VYTRNRWRVKKLIPDRFYRAVIDTPMSVSEEQALRTIGQRNGASPEEVRSAAEKVQETLSRNL